MLSLHDVEFLSAARSDKESVYSCSYNHMSNALTRGLYCLLHPLVGLDEVCWQLVSFMLDGVMLADFVSINHKLMIAL